MLLDRTVLHTVPERCDRCAVRDLSLCGTFDPERLAQLDATVTRMTAAPGQVLFSEDDPPKFLFIVTGGVVKLFKQLADGRRQITAFLFPGDYFGIPFGGSYRVSAEPVSDVALCRLQWDELDRLAKQVPNLERRLLEQSSNELASAHDQILLLGRKNARERLATFLVLLSSRVARNGGDSLLLFLPMSRGDIGDYLGLALETISREFRRLREGGLVGLPDGRHVQLLDRSRLIDLAEMDEYWQDDGRAPAAQQW